MSTFNIGSIQAETAVTGDGADVTVYAKAAPALDDLTARVEQNAATVQEIEVVLAQLREELQHQPVRRERIRELLTTLGTGAGALTAMVEGVEKVRQALGLSS